MKKCILALLMMLTVVPVAHASVVININQVGSDVTASYSNGSLNLGALGSPSTSGGFFTFITPSASVFALGSTGSLYTQYTLASGSITSPTDFGPGSFTQSNASAGSALGVSPSSNNLYVPAGYTSGAADLTGGNTWSNKNYSDLGLTTGTYTWSWGTGGAADFITMNVNAVPEPSTYALLCISLGVVGFARRNLRKTSEELSA